mgnify:CR=1 FL=1
MKSAPTQFKAWRFILRPKYWLFTHNNANICIFHVKELVDIGPRPVVMALGSVANWGGNFLVGLCFHSLYGLMNENAFLIFIGFTILLLIFIRWIITKLQFYTVNRWFYIFENPLWVQGLRFINRYIFCFFYFSMYLPETSKLQTT